MEEFHFHLRQLLRQHSEAVGIRHGDADPLVGHCFGLEVIFVRFKEIYYFPKIFSVLEYYGRNSQFLLAWPSVFGRRVG